MVRDPSVVCNEEIITPASTLGCPEGPFLLEHYKPGCFILFLFILDSYLLSRDL